MRILLFNPSWGGLVSGGRYNRRWPPLDLLNVGALLREGGHEVSLLDARAAPVPPSDFVREAVASDFVLVTTSPLDRWQCPNLEMEPLVAWTNLVPRGKLVVTGAHGTLFPEKVLDLTGARVVIRGEPEAVASALFEALARGGEDLSSVASLFHRDSEGRPVRTEDAPPPDLASFPVPAHDLARPGDYEYELLGPRLAMVETSRGCPHHCSFCLKAMYGEGGGVRVKPADRVEAELRRLWSLGFRRLYFMDLEFTLNRRRVLDLCEVLRRFSFEWCCQTRVDAVDPGLLSAMAAAGCGLVHYGIESGDAATRARVGKGITEEQIRRAVAWTGAAGMASAGFFLMGLPGETREVFQATGRLARSLPLTYASFHPVSSYCGTELGGSADAARPWWESGGTSSTPGDVGRLYLRFYLRPKYWIGMMKRGVNPVAVGRLFVQFLAGLGFGRGRSGDSGPGRRG